MVRNFMVAAFTFSQLLSENQQEKVKKYHLCKYHIRINRLFKHFPGKKPIRNKSECWQTSINIFIAAIFYHERFFGNNFIVELSLSKKVFLFAAIKAL